MSQGRRHEKFYVWSGRFRANGGPAFLLLKGAGLVGRTLKDGAGVAEANLGHADFYVEKK